MKPFILIITLALLSACGATIKDVGRTINDAADIACTLFAADHEDALQALTPQQWCAIKSNFDPFLDEILSAQQAAGSRLGIVTPAVSP